MSLADYLVAQRQRHLDELLAFLAIPSVSTESSRRHDVRRAAEYLRERFVEAGLEARVMETDGHPVVYAEHVAAPDAPTVLIYGHYDVQPPEPLDLWTSPPFIPSLRDGAIFARGASDDKGQLYAHVKGVGALLASEGALGVNVKFLIEGEEEIGSPNLDPFIEANRSLLAADVVIISDGAMIAPKTPTITYGLRGLAYVEVNVQGAAMDLHSGGFGGAAPNPINALCKMIAALHDERHRVTVPGFYDDVVELSAEEREQLARVPFDEGALAAEIGVSALPGEDGYSVLERLWTRPTLDVNGIGGGFQGEGAKTVIAAEARAKISCRLVPNQDPTQISRALGEHLKRLAPPGVAVEVRELHGGRPALTPLDAPAVRAAADALREVFGREVVFARSGGTIPVVSTLQRALEAEVVLIGFGLESDRAHSPNERFHLENYYRGIEVSAVLLKRLGAMLQ
jgi:acetylornithine deacetylase/succinyl-diaminopimelate desuccinylase-like protein